MASQDVGLDQAGPVLVASPGSRPVRPLRRVRVREQRQAHLLHVREGGMTWLYLPTSSASAPASADSTSASSWQCQSLARSAWWRGKPFASLTWSARCKRLGWLRALCGAMSPPSTADRGVAAWISSLAAIPASRSAVPASDLAPPTSDISGLTSGASSERQMLLSFSSRTSEDTSLKDSEKFWATSQPMGSMRNGVFSKRPKWEPRTNGRDSSSSRGESKLWPTPAASVANDGESPTTWLARAEQLKAKHQNGNGAGMPLTVASAMWCTPTTRDWKDTSGMTYTRKDGRSRVDLLPRQVFYAHSHQDQTTSRDGGDGSETVVLNPPFVEALMGLPIGWTDFGLSATVSSQSKRLWLSEFSSIELD